ncbi:hypothetical protein OSB04_012764 [Centaurea solstitialis]|uniref:Serine carboxypeptidase n=1 Tax=Centaurea solstitialis TaxID=347529 RepID=A0AA38TBY8_9ASTR|nr:hypothetical protein OSB04_012764 [Centaurea solstitialis]
MYGYVLSNPKTFAAEENFRIQFACDMGLISDELYKCIDGIVLANILDLDCSDFSSSIKLPSNRLTVQQPVSKLCYRMAYWANDASVREALHIRKGSKEDWRRCTKENFTTVLDDVRAYHLNLSKKGYRSLIFSGDHDMIIPHHSTQSWIKELNYSVTDQWRSWKIHGQIAGCFDRYTESYSNKMTFATIKARNLSRRRELIAKLR